MCIMPPYTKCTKWYKHALVSNYYEDNFPNFKGLIVVYGPKSSSLKLQSKRP